MNNNNNHLTVVDLLNNVATLTPVKITSYNSITKTHQVMFKGLAHEVYDQLDDFRNLVISKIKIREGTLFIAV